MNLAHQKVISFGETGLTCYDQCRWQCLHTRQFTWPSIIDGVSCHKKGKQTRVSPFNFGKWGVLNSGPWAVNHCNSMWLDYASVFGWEAHMGIWRQHHSSEFVTNGELTNKTFSNKFTTRTLLRVTVTEILNEWFTPHGSHHLLPTIHAYAHMCMHIWYSSISGLFITHPKTRLQSATINIPTLPDAPVADHLQ